jgi:hypothetical protein
VKSSDEGLAFVTHPSDGIDGLQDDGTGALRGAEEANLGLIERLQRACSP